MFNFHFLTCFCIFVDKLLKNEINDRPRKRFGYLSPNFVFLQAINNGGEKVAFMT